MRKDRQPFGIFLRKLPNGATIFYYTTYDSTGRRKQFSTGKTEHKAALKVAMARLQSGQLVPTDRLVFKTWTADWFDYERCPYIQGRRRRGYDFSRVHAENLRSYLARYLWPAFGTATLENLKTSDIETFLSEMLGRGKSADLVNRCLGTLRIILSESVRLGFIPDNPAKRVLPLRHRSAEKGILTADETACLFKLSTTGPIWKQRKVAFLAMLVAHLGGLRQGELLGLQAADLESGGVVVRHGWDRKSGIKGTKNGTVRQVPLPLEVLDAMSRLTDSGHVFSLNEGFSPVSPTYLRKALVEALEAIGISRLEQVQRHLGSHSFRHGLVSRLLASGQSSEVVAKLVGHTSTKLTIGTYHHATPAHLAALRQSQYADSTRTANSGVW